MQKQITTDPIHSVFEVFKDNHKGIFTMNFKASSISKCPKSKIHVVLALTVVKSKTELLTEKLKLEVSNQMVVFINPD